MCLLNGGEVMPRKKQYNPIVKKLENDFQDAYRSWRLTKSKKDWDKMFMLVHNACKAKLSVKLKNIYREDFDEIVLDSALKVMNALKNRDGEIDRLFNYVGLFVHFTLYNPVKEFEDKLVKETDLGLYNELGDILGEENEKVFAEEW